MTQCPRCVAALVPGGRFCGECGAAVPLTPGVPASGGNAGPSPLALAAWPPPDRFDQYGGPPASSDQYPVLPAPGQPGVPPAPSGHRVEPMSWGQARVPYPVALPAAQAPFATASPGAPGVMDGVLKQVGRLPLRELLPLQHWWSDDGWRHGRTALFLLMAFAPFALLQATSDDAGVERAAVGFAVYFAVLWLVAIRELVQPEPLGWPVLAGIGAFTTIAGVAIAVALEEELGASTDTLVSSIVTVGLPEEAAKALAILVFLRAGRRRLAPRTYLYAGAVSGLAFGAAEAVTYTTAYASFLDLSDGGLVVSLWRLLCGGLFHACMAGIVAFFIGLGAWYTELRYHLLVFGLVVAGALHGLYNYLSDGWGGAALAAFTVFTFVQYVRTGDRIGGRLAAHLAS